MTQWESLELLWADPAGTEIRNFPGGYNKQRGSYLFKARFAARFMSLTWLCVSVLLKWAGRRARGGLPIFPIGTDNSGLCMSKGGLPWQHCQVFAVRCTEWEQVAAEAGDDQNRTRSHLSLTHVLSPTHSCCSPVVSKSSGPEENATFSEMKLGQDSPSASSSHSGCCQETELLSAGQWLCRLLCSSPNPRSRPRSPL